MSDTRDGERITSRMCLARHCPDCAKGIPRVSRDGGVYHDIGDYAARCDDGERIDVEADPAHRSQPDPRRCHPRG